MMFLISLGGAAPPVTSFPFAADLAVWGPRLFECTACQESMRTLTRAAGISRSAFDVALVKFCWPLTLLGVQVDVVADGLLRREVSATALAEAEEV